MDAITYSYTRQHLADVMRQVNDDRAPVIVTSQRGRPVVIMSLDDYNAMAETAYLTQSPANAARLLAAVANVRRGNTEERTLIEGDDADPV
ncbi:type II toxin-antitoxin system prevent-host-death family antitoxin [Laribacter hongkongensis]|uniref:type II toxin-antitoxin system Phd/YefM family antitoxin n=1 Tax=Laribacter hongkongensis TaxID=168471 RepID=UPI001EFD32A7|nr:type II toxin-antitoxin system prevent-host-death family antitoxin [Laribacter hongkongensis]MCG8990848.1 type II toxin-antitoxin system prevent-host-death family antitoxin [Laribacter hongkongensis]MCG8999760.1 type II toxin-antitoxin system prevent-host-death family antitoxin [Laribacter hongkongensis]MCG9001906.1 type II toxin-antitoxin system prevent-host-death family antitoxin [Laribacter hongkongensis]MCG9003575.1 type II toxin-antitoxin system prevent-host-death family antitoxin [Lari